MKVLVCGGAGYIGSHMVRLLVQRGYEVVVLDNLVSGRKEFVNGARLVVGDCGDAKLLDEIFAKQEFAAVFHFASYIDVGESVKEPLKYYQNNVAASIILIDAVIRHKIPYFIFSSSAAVYGEPSSMPLDEKHPLKPLSPYGYSKLFVEQILEDANKAHGLKFAAMRYFNACGAHPDGGIGEAHNPETTHLIPKVLKAAKGEMSEIGIYGNDYPTDDGTCIRDYIHVCDLCEAHLAVLEYMKKGGVEKIFNLGTGQGYSVIEIIKAATKITGKKINSKILPRRAGDPDKLVADGGKASKLINWQPKFSDLETIIKRRGNGRLVKETLAFKQSFYNGKSLAEL